MTHYETLGVSPDATLAQIKAAYRKLASQHHPDREGGDKDKAAAVNDAYAVLSDSERRARYDAGQADEAPLSAEEIARRAAQHVLALVINQALGHPQIEGLGLVRTVRKILRDSRRDLKTKGDDAKKAIERLERMKPKLQRKAAAGDDVLAMLLDGKVEDQRRVARDVGEGISHIDGALKILDAYEDESQTQLGPALRQQPTSFADFINMGGAGFRF